MTIIEGAKVLQNNETPMILRIANLYEDIMGVLSGYLKANHLL